METTKVSYRLYNKDKLIYVYLLFFKRFAMFLSYLLDHTHLCFIAV